MAGNHPVSDAHVIFVAIRILFKYPSIDLRSEVVDATSVFVLIVFERAAYHAGLPSRCAGHGNVRHVA